VGKDKLNFKKQKLDCSILDFGTLY